MSEWICPVNGKPCVEPRIFQITETKGDVDFTVRCCRQCAASHVEDLNRRAYPKEHPMLPSAIEFLNTLLGDLGSFKMESTEMGIVIPIKDQPPLSPPKVEPTCAGCGCTIHDILGAGRVGCPQCYDFYKDQIGALIPSTQYGAMDHKGKSSTKKLRQEDVDPQAIIAMMRAKMEAAVLAEDYEAAAILRDQLRRIQENNFS